MAFCAAFAGAPASWTPTTNAQRATSGVPVSEVCQAEAAGERREKGQRVDDRGPERRVGATVNQDGQGDLGELIARAGLGFGEPERAVLNVRQRRVHPRRRVGLHRLPTSARSGERVASAFKLMRSWTWQGAGVHGRRELR